MSNPRETYGSFLPGKREKCSSRFEAWCVIVLIHLQLHYNNINVTNLCEMLIENNKNTIPLVSIIIPVYNAEKYLDECFQAILEQQCCFPFEV